METSFLAITLFCLYLATHGEVCLTEGCLEAANNIRSTYDPSFDPCEDFFNFACGTYLNNTSIPPELGEFGKVYEVFVKVENQTRDLLENEGTVSSIPPEILQMVRSFYKKCLNADDFILSNKLFSIVRNAKNSILPQLTDYLSNIAKEFSVDPLFNIAVEVDQHDKTIHVIYFDEINLPLGSKSFYLDEKHNSSLAAYQQFAIEVVKLLSRQNANLLSLISNDVESITKEVNKIMDFETNLAQITTTQESKTNATARYNQLTVAEMRQLMPQIDWLAYLTSISLTGYEVTSETTVVVLAPNYFTALSELLNRTEPDTVIHYCAWNLVWTYSKLLDSRYTSLRQILAVVKIMQAELTTVLHNLNWMDEETKYSAKKKVEHLVSHLGFPTHVINPSELLNYYNGLELDANSTFLDALITVNMWRSKKIYRKVTEPYERDKLDFNAAIVNAFYEPTTNGLNMPAGFLQPPFFKNSYPACVNYGAIGSVIGHELTHAFDDQGSQFDHIGKLRNWWSNDSETQFKEKVNCFIDQYNSYHFEEVNITINGKFTQTENVADAGGMDLAWRAYKVHLARMGNPEITLPGINLTADQLFFVSSASFECTKYTNKALVHNLKTDPHSLERFRVRGTLSNLKEFADTFNCKANTAYNPTTKCEMW